MVQDKYLYKIVDLTENQREIINAKKKINTCLPNVSKNVWFLGITQNLGEGEKSLIRSGIFGSKPI
jgi:hypothetical protein